MIRPVSGAPLPRRVRVVSDEAGTMGGAAKAALLLCEALARGGSKVDLFVTANPEPAVRKRLEEYGVRIRISPVRWGSRYRIPSRANGLRVWLTMVFSPRSVVHAVGMQSEVVQILSMPGRFRTFVWETTDALPGNKFVRPQIPALLRKVEAVVVPSHAVERNVRDTYRFNGRIEMLPFWTDDRGHHAAQPVADDTKRFLFIGRMDADKGFRYLVPAFSALRDEGNDIALDICGSGNPLRIPELAANPPGVVARGSVSEEEVAARFENCFAFVLPSLHEGYPLTLLEACSYGKPIIATTVGSVPEVFAGRECAILVPPHDQQALAAAMRTLLREDAATYARRSAEARALYDELCAPEIIVEKLSAVYREVR